MVTTEATLLAIVGALTGLFVGVPVGAAAFTRLNTDGALIAFP